MSTLFDNSIRIFVFALAEIFDDSELALGTVLRDAEGRLSYVSAQNAPTESICEERSTILRNALGAYARAGVILYADDSGASQILRGAIRVPMSLGSKRTWLLDRRIVGTGWQTTPRDTLAMPPRVIFASLKGGVGRSTALMVTAADLAEKGRNVLVVDLDLEAPGLGESLLDESSVPEFGVVDFLVENGIGGVDPRELEKFVGVSTLTEGRGRVDVVPAFGHKANTYPQNVLPKLARAMLDDVDLDGRVVSVGEQISSLIDQLAQRQEYDVVLIDSRAGLAELAAPAILNLGGLVLLFGTAQQQTISGYRALFAGLKALAVHDISIGKNAEWRYMLKPIYAKSTLDRATTEQHFSDLYDLFSENIYDAEFSAPDVLVKPFGLSDDQEIVGWEIPYSDKVLDSNDAMQFSEKDTYAPHWPWIIPFDPKFASFDPRRTKNQLNIDFYEQVYRPFLDSLYEKIAEISRRVT